MEETLCDNVPIISVDECHFSENVIPLYGYQQRGNNRPVLKGRTRDRKSVSLLMAMGNNGVVHSKIITTNVNRNIFRQFVEGLPFPRGSVLQLDNCSIHHGLQDVYDKLGYKPLFLPPYSPQFQPIELAFSKIKHMFRQQWPFRFDNHGTESDIHVRISNAISSVSSENIISWFNHCQHEVEHFK